MIECGEFVIDISFFFQAEDGIRDLVRSRGLGDVYKRQIHYRPSFDSSIRRVLKRVTIGGEMPY